MPWKSEQQRKWGHTKEGTKALGGKQAVAEWERATGNKKLPKYAKKKKYSSEMNILLDFTSKKIYNYFIK